MRISTYIALEDLAVEIVENLEAVQIRALIADICNHYECHDLDAAILADRARELQRVLYEEDMELPSVEQFMKNYPEV